jgi:DNA polymerase III epsilon subunit-like protein
MDSGYIIYVIDTETTGIDPVEHDVIEISAARFTLGNTNIDQKTWLLKALNPASITERALEVNKHKRADITHQTAYGRKHYLEPADVILDIEQWFMDDDESSMDRIFAGQNVMFDVRMLLNLWRKVDSSDTFPFDIDSVSRGNRIIDTKQLALIVDICTGHRRQYYNLGTLVKFFGAKKAKAHTAAGDVQMTTDLFMKILEVFTPAAIEKFSKLYGN